MPVRVFTIPFDPRSEMFFDDEVNAFLLDKQVISARPEFFQMHGKPYWSVFVEYTELLSEEPRNRAVLNDEQKLLFQRLREWRKARAEQDGVPAFLIATNSELTQVSKHAPRSREALRQIRGFGQKKTQKYGPDLLALIVNFYDETQGTHPPAPSLGKRGGEENATTHPPAPSLEKRGGEEDAAT